jgi:dihydrolipoamide dehydrogenase
MDEIIPGWDAELARGLHRILTRQGMKILTSTKIVSSEVKSGKATLAAEDQKGDAVTLEAERVLVAAGRRPCTHGIGMEEAGVKLDERSRRVVVDDQFMAAPSIYAIGDIIDGPALAHKAEEEGVAVAEILAGGAGHVNYEVIPGVVYTHPEVASVGMTEEQLGEVGTEYVAGSFSFKANGRALASAQAEGMVKILADKEHDTVLGVHILGPGASELIAEAVTVMEYDGSAEDVARTVHAHPTLSETVKEAALDVADRAIHAPPKKRKA